ncbi:class I SAM-dependent methyltransferase [Oerskovia turbata]|uniref:Class I SAM-dependent methyltransferase n=1 Tax=Oerskovia turbata TaxID=1713 RepID=A0A4Q1KP59_9CELL|nr:class I SAM-dependent methyltransferase [Oerskovia turbata]RXR23104.1 class I SAM-dependent methyltransferase [Oerskovia turbata]RXR31697.1 class I SAM-dependent methyltransferase [Oerskovia turbata]TGJ97233.1 class I SAM-dependent methyltransferase [Actinotalea fermentans ATCC 43279 = JCM 9966 = DSM 3133]
MSDPYWNHSTHYFPVLTRLVGPGTRSALDVGCGEGLLTRRLRAAGAAEVLGLDLDPEQVDRARQTAGGSPTGLDYLAGDVLDPLPGLAEPFDLVTTVATLHHLPLDAGLRRLRDLVAPGGTLAVVGLTRPRTAWDWTVSAAAVPAAKIARRRRGEWEHGSPIAEVTTSHAELRAAAREILPGARLHRRLYWRYTLVWRAPETGES